MARKSRIGESRIRQLRPGEPVPDGEPRRYTSDARGYVRLRWKVGKGEYVEAYEHRLIAGMPDAEVHHGNEVKDDNRPENLHALGKSEHAIEHAARMAAQAQRWTEWGGLRSRQAFDKQQSRLAREDARRAWTAAVAARYREGASTIDLAAEFGRSPGTISRALREAGIAPQRGKKAHRVGSDVRQLVHGRAGMRCERCDRNLTWGGGQIHHRRPRGMGGSLAADTNTPANLLLLCLLCHRWVEEQRDAAVADGLLVRSGADPEVVPVHLHGGWFGLSADGSKLAV